MNGIFRKSMLGDRPLYDKSKIQSHHFTLCFSSWSPIAQRLFPHRWGPSVFEIETNISVLLSEARCTSFQILINYQFRACAEITQSVRPMRSRPSSLSVLLQGPIMVHVGIHCAMKSPH